MYRITRFAGVCLAIAMLMVLTGCSGSLRKNYMRDKAAEHVYRKPLAEIWPRVHEVMNDKGYSWRENPGRYVLETEWRESGGGTLGPTTSSKFLVEGVSRADGGCVLRVQRLDRTTQEIGTNYTDGVVRTRTERAVAISGGGARSSLPTQQTFARDLQMELELLQRIDPEAAARLEADAKSAHP
ncbi:hypothetical protein [Myxococcus sp. RHSTA-1-4]|uniref:hypothetical protein n=1 Tax=Myxococcus sp. RHSTA-1-4 TaxID=2874601 RepID=UPI001CBC4F9C|nr:hypothetical protein [Myxococcus sp. RHSTA-1-4]MBZ4422125.1 hypothetical protein [Myxococcus sp. RHSTA-1-4]